VGAGSGIGPPRRPEPSAPGAILTPVKRCFYAGLTRIHAILMLFHACQRCFMHVNAVSCMSTLIRAILSLIRAIPTLIRAMLMLIRAI